MDTHIVKMSNIVKTFPGVKALKSVSFDLRPGEIHALIGENGAGKSTLMNVLMGIYHPDSGEILVQGNKQEIHSPVEAITLGISMVPQELSLVPNATVAENLFLGNEIRFQGGLINWQETKKQAKLLLDDLGVSISVDALVENLSVAYQQLVQIARSLATGANVLIFDEPTASLTANEVETLFSIFRKIRRNNKSIVFISHHLEEIIQITDRVTIMRDGAVVHQGDTKDITIDEIIAFMAGRNDVQRGKSRNRSVEKKTILSIRDFSKTGEFHDINFDVYKGEIFGIGGLVGSKRTELINSIFGLTKKTSGRTFFQGKEINIISPDQAITFGIGYLPEERRRDGIFPILSVKENLMITLYARICGFLGINFKKAENITKNYIEKLRIKTPSGEVEIKNLSGGNQQKVILSRWLARNVDLLILDEPTRGIDVNAKYEIYELIRDLSDNGLTVLIVSSEHEELLALTDRIMVMHEGRNKGILITSETKQEDILMTALKNEG